MRLPAYAQHLDGGNFGTSAGDGPQVLLVIASVDVISGYLHLGSSNSCLLSE